MNEKRKLVVVITHGLDDERASVAWSITLGGINSGHDVSVFLVSSGVDWVRKGAADRPHLNPEDPTMKEMIQMVIESGGKDTYDLEKQFIERLVQRLTQCE